jgi:hypothetical protein
MFTNIAHLSKEEKLWKEVNYIKNLKKKIENVLLVQTHSKKLDTIDFAIEENSSKTITQ